MKVYTQEKDIPYTCIKKLGEGSFAEVFLAESNQNGKRFAIKKIQINPLYEGPQGEVSSQIQRLKQLKGDHIIEYYDSFIIERQIWIIMRLCNGSLRDIMQKKKKFTTNQILSILIQITNAMIVLNNHHTMHLDLKPENVLFVKDIDMRLSDFGCSEMIKKGSFSKLPSMDSVYGTTLYICPQIKLGQNGGFRASQDVWSLGVIIYQLLYGVHPIPNPEESMRAYWQEQKVIKFPRVSQDKKPLRNLLRQMLQIHPQRRPTWKKVKKLIINNLQRHEVEFCSVSQAFQMYSSTIEMFILILREIKINEEGHAHKFWQLYSKDLKNNILCLMYLYSHKFKQLFGFKMNEKIKSKDMKDYEFWRENSKIEVQKYFKNKQSLPALKDIEYYENSLDNLLRNIKKELNDDKQKWNSLKKFWVFSKEADQMSEPDFFCCSKYFPETIKLFSINS